MGAAGDDRIHVGSACGVDHDDDVQVALAAPESAHGRAPGEVRGDQLAANHLVKATCQSCQIRRLRRHL
jgi:hypothetical protein